METQWSREDAIAAVQKSKELGIGRVPNLWVDSGPENINKDVGKLIESGLITRTIVQLEVWNCPDFVECIIMRIHIGVKKCGRKEGVPKN